jgi:hypothetical protein
MENGKYRFFATPRTRFISEDDAVNSRTFNTINETRAYIQGLRDARNTKTLRQHIAAKQRKVCRERRADLKSWIFSKKDSPYAPHERGEAYKSFLKSDVNPLLEVARLYVQGEYAKAATVAGNMDTAPREYIIAPIWEAINV